MMKILLLGDTHGDWRWIQHAYQIAIKYKIDALFQLGDFGFWDWIIIRKIAACYSETGIPFYWLDGNHEDYRLLKGLKQDYTDPSKFIEMDDGVFYSPRGHSWEWEGVKFMSMGGAYSIDRGLRELDVDWFKEEEVTEANIEIAKTVGKIDVLLSHDVPESANIDSVFANRMMRFLPSHASHIHRCFLEEVAAETKPFNVFHGHYHLRYSKTVRPPWDVLYQCIGLDASYNVEKSLLILNLDKGTLDFNMNEDIYL